MKLSELFLAHGDVGIKETDVLLFLAFAAAWGFGGLLVLINPILISTTEISGSRRAMHYGWWCLYVVLWLVLTFEPSDKSFLGKIPAPLRWITGFAVPLLSISHFAWLCWLRRKDRGETGL